MGSQISDMAGAMCNVDEPPSRGEEELSAEQLVAIFGSPMHAAAILGTASDIAALSAAGHDAETRDKAGRTPCHVAAISGNLKNLQALITAGAQLEVEDHQGDTPLQCAVNMNRHEVVRWIKWHRWCDQGKFRESNIEPPQPFEGFGGSNMDPYASQSVPVNSHDQSPMTSPRKNRRGKDYSIPYQVAFARPVRRAYSPAFTTDIGTPRKYLAAALLDDEPLPPEPKFAWQEAQVEGKCRRLASILRLLKKENLALEESELRELISHSDDDMVRAVVMAQDRYLTPTRHGASSTVGILGRRVEEH